MFMTISIWITKTDLESFKKFYDDVNNNVEIKSEEIPEIEFFTQAPPCSSDSTVDYLQLNVIYEIYEVMCRLLKK